MFVLFKANPILPYKVLMVNTFALKICCIYVYLDIKLMYSICYYIFVVIMSSLYICIYYLKYCDKYFAF